MSLPEAVVFDLDGTLIDSIPDVRNAVNAMLAAYGRGPLDLEALRGMVGYGARPMLEMAFAATGGGPVPGDAQERYLAEYRADPAGSTHVYEGAVEALDALAAAGVALGVCTNKPSATTRLVLERLGLLARFAAVVCGDETAHPKPDGRHVAETLSAMGRAAGRAVYVGDSAPDVQAARAAGLPSIVVTFGYDGEAALRHGADAAIDRYADLLATLERLA